MKIILCQVMLINKNITHSFHVDETVGESDRPTTASPATSSRRSSRTPKKRIDIYQEVQLHATPRSQSNTSPRNQPKGSSHPQGHTKPSSKQPPIDRVQSTYSSSTSFSTGLSSTSTTHIEKSIPASQKASTESSESMTATNTINYKYPKIEKYFFERLEQIITFLGGTAGCLENWSVQVIKRSGGLSEGIVDVYYYNPKDKKFRNRVEVAVSLGLMPAITQIRNSTRDQHFIVAMENRERFLVSHMMGVFFNNDAYIALLKSSLSVDSVGSNTVVTKNSKKTQVKSEEEDATVTVSTSTDNNATVTTTADSMEVEEPMKVINGEEKVKTAVESNDIMQSSNIENEVTSAPTIVPSTGSVTSTTVVPPLDLSQTTSSNSHIPTTTSTTSITAEENNSNIAVTEEGKKENNVTSESSPTLVAPIEALYDRIAYINDQVYLYKKKQMVAVFSSTDSDTQLNTTASASSSTSTIAGPSMPLTTPTTAVTEALEESNDTNMQVTTTVTNPPSITTTPPPPPPPPTSLSTLVSEKPSETEYDTLHTDSYFTIGNCTILNWGEILINEPGFHTWAQIFPIGFKCLRQEHDLALDRPVDVLLEIDKTVETMNDVLVVCPLFRISVHWEIPIVEKTTTNITEMNTTTSSSATAEGVEEGNIQGKLNCSIRLFIFHLIVA